MQLREIMSSDLHAIPHNATIQEAAKLMRDHDIGMIPVTENGRMTGAITDRDIAVRAVARGGDSGKIPVSQAMTSDIYFLFEDTDVAEAAQLMEQRQIRRLIVANRSKQPVGVVSLGDLALAREGNGLAGEVLREVSKPTSEAARAK